MQFFWGIICLNRGLIRATTSPRSTWLRATQKVGRPGLRSRRTEEYAKLLHLRSASWIWMLSTRLHHKEATVTDLRRLVLHIKLRQCKQMPVAVVGKGLRMENASLHSVSLGKCQVEQKNAFLLPFSIFSLSMTKFEKEVVINPNYITWLQSCVKY